ncbi:MAG TPA: TspO protein [Candidatus Moranbacteria bacterium]|nr:MAG: integral membrane protein, tryptophan-rich sensory protein [Parcubacteria group bacterium GW2011_GWC1_45_14]HAV11346.1 TspO protein [Candidatus Moranbacteria bacterium]
MKKLQNAYRFFVSIFIAQSAGIIGSIFTLDSVSVWYPTLEKPFFSPPNWIFGSVWISLYTLMGISFYIIWQRGIERREVRFAMSLFLFHLALNALWSIFFFGFQSPLLAFVEIVILWAVIVWMIFKFWKISRLAAYLLLPYIVWVSFAAILNFSIFILNR